MNDHDYLSDMNKIMDRIIQLQNHINYLQDSIIERLEIEEGMLEVIKGLQERIYKLENPDE